MDVSTPLTLVASTLMISGLGIGLFTSPNSSAILGAVPPQQRGVANGVLGTARTLGMVLGVGIAGAVYASMIGQNAAPAPAEILAAANMGLLVASGVAVVGAVTSATRPAVDVEPGLGH
jgi:MFS family permease